MKVRKYSVKEKKQIVAMATASSIHSVSKKMGIDRKRIREWIQQSAKGMYDDVANTVVRLPGAGRPVVDAKVDQELHEWLLCQRQKGFRVTGMNNKADRLKI